MTGAKSSPDTILVSRSPGETRYALLAGEEVVEIVHRRDGDVQPGAIYLGRVGPPVPGVDAVFVHIGEAAPAVVTVRRPPPEGTAVAVRVVVPPRADKGAEVKMASDTKYSETEKKPPKMLAEPSDPALDWWMRHHASIVRIVCEPASEATRLRTMIEPHVPIESASSSDDIFSAYGADEVIEAALAPQVALPCGGNLVIEETAAVIAIDVNSGPARPSEANREAVDTAARELRRRNISGHIVIDVIPGKGNAALPRLLAKALEDDPAPVRVAGVTPLGMIEMTRNRIGLSLAETLLDGGGALSIKSVALHALRKAVRAALVSRRAGVELAVSPSVAEILKGTLRPALTEAEQTIKGVVSIKSMPEFSRSRIEIA